MNAPRTTGLVLAGAACGTVALALTGSFATPAPAAPPHAVARTNVTVPAAPTPEALRRAAVDGMSAIDTSDITKLAAGAAKACDAVQAPAQQNAQACTSVKEHLGALTTARATLLQQSTAAAPDVNAITAATTNAVAATVTLAKKDAIVPKTDAAGPTTRSVVDPNRGIDGFAHGGLLGTVTNILRGAVGALGGLAGGALVGLGSLLGRLVGFLVGF
ncbi:hypothetical protein [Streptomyces sp. NPDC002537]